MTEVFWLESPADLFKRTSLVPLDGDTVEMRYNMLTRCALVAGIVLFAIKCESWLAITLGLLAVIAFAYYYASTKSTNTYTSSQENTIETYTNMADNASVSIVPKEAFEEKKQLQKGKVSKDRLSEIAQEMRDDARDRRKQMEKKRRQAYFDSMPF